MHEKFIVLTFGYYGYGSTLNEAYLNVKKAGAGGDIRKKGDGYVPKKGVQVLIFKFTSKLPFAPPDREATEEEADAYITKDGTTCWVRCERERLEPQD